MNRMATVAVMSFSLLCMPAAWAADPAEPATATDVADTKKPDEVLKTKTRSNQSNDREAAEPAQEVKDEDKADAEQPAEVLKTKTKSNQSND